MAKDAILLVNLGTPDNCNEPSVRRYLKEFLSDPRVIDLPYLTRKLLVNAFIIPFRNKRVTAAYKKIWTENGSPLLHYSLCLREKLSQELGPKYQVELGMRYGNPSIASAMSKLVDATSLTVVPLFPQYSSAATGSAIEQVLKTLAPKWNIPQLKIIRDFYNHPDFIKAYAERIDEYIKDKKIDLLLFSYHGLPERHINKSDCKAKCDRKDSCPPVSESNAFCYRAQCFETTKLIAEQLRLSPDKYAVSFQSRLGRTPWIKPYTDVLLPELAKKGIKNLAIVSPSFVADCLETLEEIDIRTREQWHSLQGNEFLFIPCLNDSSLWIKALVDFLI